MTCIIVKLRSIVMLVLMSLQERGNPEENIIGFNIRIVSNITKLRALFFMNQKLIRLDVYRNTFIHIPFGGFFRLSDINGKECQRTIIVAGRIGKLNEKTL